MLVVCVYIWRRDINFHLQPGSNKQNYAGKQFGPVWTQMGPKGPNGPGPQWAQWAQMGPGPMGPNGPGPKWVPGPNGSLFLIKVTENYS